MTKEEVENVIKRYPYVSKAIKQKLSRAEFYIGNRKFVIDISEAIKSVCKIIKLIYNTESDSYIKQMISCILNGKTDIYIINKMPYEKNSYYAKKKAFIEKVYKCCIAWNLVSFEEVLGEDIA